MNHSIDLLEVERAPFAGGHAFGTAGDYERIVGKVAFRIDPADPRTRMGWSCIARISAF